MNRRDYLGTVAGIVTAATVPIAGCSTGVGEVPPPEFPESQMDGWARIDERVETVFKKEVAGSTIEAKAHALAYEDSELRRDIETETGGVDHPVSTIGASRVAVSGGLGGPTGTEAGIADRVEAAATDRFESRLEKAGVENIERTSIETVTVDSGVDARYRRYAADLTFDTDAAGVAEADSLPVTGDLVSWRAEDTSLIVGAAYPAESLSTTVERRGGDASDIDTGYDAGAYREKIRAVITAIE